MRAFPSVASRDFVRDALDRLNRVIPSGGFVIGRPMTKAEAPALIASAGVMIRFWSSAPPTWDGLGRDPEQAAQLLLLSEQLEFLRRADYAIATGELRSAGELQYLGLARTAEDKMRIVLIQRGQNRDGQDERMTSVVHGGSHRLDAHRSVNAEHLHLQSGGSFGRVCDSVRDVVEFSVVENTATQRMNELDDHGTSNGREQLQPDLEAPHMRRQAFHESSGSVQTVHVQSHNNLRLPSCRIFRFGF